MESQPESAWLESSSNERTPIRGSCSIGRTPSNTVVVADDKISRRHAMINTQQAGEYWLIDLGSSNGTYLNGRRVSQPCRLADTDQIEMGGYRFVFRHPRGNAASPREFSTDKTIQDMKSLPCWLLVADLEASTQLTQKFPADLAARHTSSWLAQCKQIIETNAGSINKFLGDGFFAYWLHTERSADAVVGAVQALKALQDVAERRFRMVVHHGQIFVGGGASLGEESLLGVEVNFVFRMEKLAASLGVLRLISEQAASVLGPRLRRAEEHRAALTSFDGEFLFHEF